jgi:hypothetical protein
LPSAITGTETKGYLNYPEEAESILKEWERTGVLGVAIHSKGTPDQNVEQVPRSLLLKIEKFLKKHKDTQQRNIEKATKLMVTLEPENKLVQERLLPVVRQWLEESRWFVKKAHEDLKVTDTDEKELGDRFLRFENTLMSLISFFYHGLEKVEGVISSANESKKKPSDSEVDDAVSLLGRAQYYWYFFDRLNNPFWIAPLKNKGFFKEPPQPKKEESGAVSYSHWPQGRYLKRTASSRPAEVMEIIKAIKSDNPFVKVGCIECLMEMPIETAAKGVSIVQDIFERKSSSHDWFWGGEEAAKLMVKLSECYENESFGIAQVLLDVWKPEDSEKSIFNDIIAKFASYEYMNLVFKHYKKLWERYPFRAGKVLFEIFERYLKELDKSKGFDVSEHFYITTENLDAIDGRLDRDYIAILVKGICETGKAIKDKEPDRFDEFLNLLRSSNKAIFKRIEMYLLRFAPKGSKTERISEILLDKNLFENSGFRYEYDLLLLDKIDEVQDKVEGSYKKWIQEIGVDKKDFAEWFKKTRGREYTPEDLGKYESRMRAAKLFLVREKFPELYEKCKVKAGATDAELMPEPMIGDVRAVDPTEDSPKSVEEAIKMAPSDFVDYLFNPANYEGKKKPEQWHEPKEALAATFREVVKQRPKDYINLDINQRLLLLPPSFLSGYFYAAWDVVRSKDWKREYWGPLLDLAQSAVEKYNSDKEYRHCFSAILSMLRDGFGESERSVGFNEETIRTFWGILKPLIGYAEDSRDESFERDPVQMRCNSVKGQALEQVVMLGVVCKRDYEKLYNEYLKNETRGVLDYVVNEVKRTEVNSTFGTDFARIYWLDEEWLKNNLDKILEGEMWDIVWGTYMSWGRPSLLGFKLLSERGKYQQAIGLIGTPNRYKFGEDPEKGLTSHLMIAFFNGWLKDDCRNELLNEFLKKAPAKLRGYAASFLTTGFKGLKENPNPAISGRLRAYWEMRLVAVSENAKENIEETVEFVGWVKDSPFETQETFELLYKTLELTGGKIGGGRSPYDFLEGVCDIAKNNELMALQCLNKAMADEQMGTFISLYKDKLTGFMDSIVGLGDDYREIQDIRKEAIKLADAYGRRHIYDFRKHYEALQRKMGGV